MRASTLCTILLAALCFFALPQRAEAARGVSIISYDSFYVYGYSETSLTYTEAYYYDAAVSSAMYDQYGFLRSDGYSEGDSLAIVNTRTSASPGVRYDLYSNHYAKTYFYYCDYYCDSPRYYDTTGSVF
jgi:hypothetical protein